MLKNFTWIIPFFNEESSLRAQKKQFSIVQNILAVDAGSTDKSLSILSEYQNITVVNRRNPNNRQRTPEWYEGLYSLAPTKYILFGNCNHFYSIEYLVELDNIAGESKHVFCVSDHINYMYGRSTRVFSAYTNPIWPFRQTQNVITLKPHQHISPHFFNKKFIRNDFFRIHQERPIGSNCSITGVKTKAIFFSFKSDLSSQIEIKHALYASEHVLSETPRALPIPLQCFFVYIKHFIHQYCFRMAFLDGSPGFVLSHYWSLYHVSVLIRAWERVHIGSRQDLEDINSSIKSQLLHKR